MSDIHPYDIGSVTMGVADLEQDITVRQLWTISKFLAL